jgi:hypothetical protein
MDDLESLYDQLDAYAGVIRNRDARIADLESKLTAKTELATLYAASLRKSEAEVEGLRKDAERLDFMIDERVWIQWTVRDGSIRQCQVYDQDEDENYIVRSGEDRYFNTAREAIDYALASQKEG